MSHIFLSYSRKNEIIADTIASVLINEGGINVWQDTSGKGLGIPFSTKWSIAIEDAVYNAMGAVIIKSKEWESSVPCSNELKWIEESFCPHIFITPDVIENSIDWKENLLEWARKVVLDGDNKYRSFLVSCAYRIGNGDKPKNYYPRESRSFGRFFNSLESIKDGFDLADDYKDKNPDLYKKIIKFLKGWKGFIIRNFCVKTFIAIALPIMVIGSFFVVKLTEEVSKEVASHYEKIEVSSTVYNYKETLPRNTFEYLLAQKEVLLEMKEDGAKVLYDACLVNVPVEYYDRGAIPDSVSESFNTLNNDGAYKGIVENGRLKIETIDRDFYPEIFGELSCFDINDEDGSMVCAYGNAIYYYDLNLKNEPELLAKNSKDIESVGYGSENGKTLIFAKNIDGNVLVWKIPKDAKKDVQDLVLDTADYETKIEAYSKNLEEKCQKLENMGI